MESALVAAPAVVLAPADSEPGRRLVEAASLLGRHPWLLRRRADELRTGEYASLTAGRRARLGSRQRRSGRRSRRSEIRGARRCASDAVPSPSTAPVARIPGGLLGARTRRLAQRPQ